MQLVRDVPGQRLLLEEVSGESAARLMGAFLASLGVLFMVVVDLFDVEGWAEIGQRIGGGWAVLLFLLLWFGLVGLVVAACARGLHRVTRIAAERSSGDLYVEASGLFGRRRIRVSVPLENIDALLVRASTSSPDSSGTPLAMHLELRARIQGKPRRVKFDFVVEQLDHWEEALDFALRLAQVIGLPHHRVQSEVPKSLTVELAREPKKGFTPLPEVRSEADYASEQVDERVALVEEAPPPFSPSTFPTSWQIAEWRPGDRVRFLAPREWFTPPLFIATLVLLVGAAMLVSVYTGKGRKEDRDTAVVAGWIASVAGAVGGALSVVFHKQRTVECDWGAHAVRFQRSWSRLEVPFTAIQEVEVRLVSAQGAGKSAERFFCQVLARVDAGGRGGATGELLIEGTPIQGKPKALFGTARSLGTELARAMGVPLRCARRVKLLLEAPARGDVQSPLK